VLIQPGAAGTFLEKERKNKVADVNPTHPPLLYKMLNM
jgi:hypothetical protein